MRLAWPTLPPALAAVSIAMLLLAAVRRAGLQHWLLPSLYIGGLAFPMAMENYRLADEVPVASNSADYFVSD
jgi:hypothetical protein